MGGGGEITLVLDILFFIGPSLAFYFSSGTVLDFFQPGSCILKQTKKFILLFIWVDSDLDMETRLIKCLVVCFCLFLLLYVPCQQLWSLRDGQFT